MSTLRFHFSFKTPNVCIDFVPKLKLTKICKSKEKYDSTYLKQIIKYPQLVSTSISYQSALCHYEIQ